MLVTDQEILDFLRLDDEGEEVSMVKMLRDSVEAFVKTYTGRTFEENEYNEYYDVPECSGGLAYSKDWSTYVSNTSYTKIYLKNYPVTSITSIKLYTDSTTYSDITDFQYKQNGILNVRIPRLYNGFNSLLVSYTAGYVNDSVPEDLKLAIKNIIKYNYMNNKENLENVSSYSLGDLSVTYDKQMIYPKYIIDSLDLYKRIKM